MCIQHRTYGAAFMGFFSHAFNLFRATNLYPDLRTLEDLSAANYKCVELEERLQKASN